MAPNLQLSRLSGGADRKTAAALFDGEDLEVGGGGDLEDVRLLDSYEDNSPEGVGGEAMRRIQVRVTGMTCAACSNSVEEALRSVDGVLRASVALLQNKADVVYDPSLVKVS